MILSAPKNSARGVALSIDSRKGAEGLIKGTKKVSRIYFYGTLGWPISFKKMGNISLKGLKTPASFKVNANKLSLDTCRF